ncbi:MAG: hypothetical protein JSR46_04545 [Verrucomicrobia bacterium]|nr:hypothetical protein [Verrucomicrobiota bacterium]
MDALLEQLLSTINSDKSIYCLKSVCESLSIDRDYLLATLLLSDDEEMKSVMNMCLNSIRGHILESFLYGHISQMRALEYVHTIDSELDIFPLSLKGLASVVSNCEASIEEYE